MTQPVDPFAPPPPPALPPPPNAALPVENYGVAYTPPPAPAPGEPAPPAEQTWVEKQQAAMAEREAQREMAKSAEALEAARKAQLREKHGAIATTASQYFRGGLDALLIPGALLGAATEGLGEATGSKTLKDFGRSVGKASTGKTAMEVLAFVLSGGGDEGRALADAQSRLIREQQEARPTLSTVSRLAGTAATGLGIGSAASGHATAAQMLGVNVVEGMGAGAQVAYEESAPLRDVLKSMAIGGIIGAGATGAAVGGEKVLRKVPDLAKVFGEKMQGEADKLAIKAAAGADSQLWNQVASDPARRARLAGVLRDANVIGQNADEIADAMEAGAARFSAEEMALARQLDDAKLPAPNLLGEVDRLIAKHGDALTGEGQAVKGALENTVEPLRQRLAIMQPDAAGNPVRIGYRAPTFQELAQFRNELRPLTKLGGNVTSGVADAHRQLFATVAKNLDDAAKSAGPSVSKAWRETAQAADDLTLLSLATERGAARSLKAPLVSAGEIQSGLTAAIGTLAMSANPIAALGGMIGGALVHKAANKLGSAALSTLSNRFARMGTRVSLRAAGGREMAEVLTALKRTKQFAAEMAESAGTNPVSRQQAENLAMDVAAQQLEKRAGKFDAATWADKPLNPLQKVFYRGQVLDSVSTDLAAAAERTRTLHPALPESLDVSRLSRLTKDATPEALGLLQSRVREIASIVPPTPTGEAAAVALRRLAGELDRTGPTVAFDKAHQLASYLDNSAAIAMDEPTQEFVKNAARQVRVELSGEQWGEAGKLYGALANPSDILADMTDATKLREGLTALQGHGALTGALKQAQDQVAKAYDAAAKLAGITRPKALGKEFQEAEHLFHAAEEALTLDGKAMERMFEVGQHAGIHEAAHPHTQANEMTVAETVDGELDHIVPVLRDAATGGSPRVYRPGVDKAAAATLPKTIETQREEYRDRLRILTDATAGKIPQDERENPIIMSEANDAMAQLLKDMPKPPSDALGSKGPQALSQDDLRLANAMWEATTEPLSVFRDLASGSLDPDKAKYAWKQYPGLQTACQAGIIDCLSNDLTQEERDMLPENILTQLDSTFGFGGKLQETSDFFFASRMSEVYHAESTKAPPAPPAGGMLKLPGADPTFTQRIAGG